MKYPQRRFLLIFFSLVIIFGVTFLIIKNYFSPFVNRAALLPTPSVTPQPIESDEVESPDGVMKLVMQTENQTDGGFNYSLIAQTEEGENKKLLWTTTASRGEFSLTPNAWSPDNKYLYVVQEKNGLVNALVFRATGEVVKEDKQYLDVLSVFEKTVKDYLIRDITGWDSPTLLHVRTKVDDVTKGPSYWFDISSQRLLRLVRR